MTRITAAAVAVAALLALPATGNASESFGSLLKHSPANGSDQCVETVTGPCTLVGWINPNDAGDPVTSPAPADGVIVKFRIRSSAAESVTFRLATIDKQGDVALAQGAGVGPTVTLAGTEEIEEFPAGVRVHRGDHVALDAPSSHMVYNQGGDEFTYLYAPQLVDGQGPRTPPASCSCRRSWSPTPTGTASVTRPRTPTSPRPSSACAWPAAGSTCASPRPRRSASGSTGRRTAATARSAR
jgi:hypothetical protein